ncbi:MAG: sulfurtransferase TusA family protein [Alphaproteobacteria bacterium]
MTAQPRILDATGLRCPLPVLRAHKVLSGLEAGTLLEVAATDPAAPADFEAFCRETGHELIGIETDDDVHRIRIRKKS